MIPFDISISIPVSISKSQYIKFKNNLGVGVADVVKALALVVDTAATGVRVSEWQQRKWMLGRPPALQCPNDPART